MRSGVVINISLFFCWMLCFTTYGHSNFGKDSTTLKLYDEKGKVVNLSKYKGKVVYIDFWATWCGGCKQYLEWSKDLHKKFTKKELKQIVFVYISIDNDTLAWQKEVKRLKLPGEQLVSPAHEPDGAQNYFKVTGLPRYIMLDKKGNIAINIAKTPYKNEAYDDLIRLAKD